MNEPETLICMSTKLVNLQGAPFISGKNVMLLIENSNKAAVLMRHYILLGYINIISRIFAEKWTEMYFSEVGWRYCLLLCIYFVLKECLPADYRG